MKETQADFLNQDQTSQNRFQDAQPPQGSVEVVRAALHQSIDLPQQGGVSTSLYKGKGITMHYHASGLYCSFKNKRFIVPLANVIYVWESLNDK